MKEIKEVVELPSAETKPFVHPLELSPARTPYLAGWWLQRLASLPVAFLLGTVLWVISNNLVTPFVVPLVVLTFAALAAQFYIGQAWQFIPRKRQDRQRDPGGRLQLAGSLIDAIALVAGLLILIRWASRSRFPDGVEEFVIGAGAGIAALQLGQVVIALVRPRRDWVGVASQVLALVAVVVAVLVASATLLEGQWSAESATVALMGGGMMVAVQLLLWLIQVVGQRRSRRESGER